MLIKAGVDISRLNKEIRRALNVIQGVLGKFKEELVITSTYEGNHMPSSLHYHNDAVDIRLAMPSRGPKIKQELKKRLGDNFDVLLEMDHIHIEYDPR